MTKKDLSFEEIRADKDGFLEQYGVAKKFRDCNVSWKTLMEIGDDYEEKCFGSGRENQEYRGRYADLIREHIDRITTFENLHSYSFRLKKTGSLLAKVIRKGAQRGGEYTPDNYFHKITDLLGIRILHVFKEDYWAVHQQIMKEYGNQLSQNIIIKLKRGDDEEMFSKLTKEYSNVKPEENNTYRSIHYTVYADTKNMDDSPHLEIQTRTIFEEGWSEINHRLVYKQSGEENDTLRRLSETLSSMVGACDSIGTLMKMIEEAGKLSDSSIKGKDGISSAEDSDTVQQILRNFLMK